MTPSTAKTAAKEHCIEKLSHTFGDVAPGELVAYEGSSGYLEIAIREANAAQELSLDVGDTILIEDAQ